MIWKAARLRHQPLNCAFVRATSIRSDHDVALLCVAGEWASVRPPDAPLSKRIRQRRARRHGLRHRGRDMSGISGWFFKSAVIYVIVGMALGIHMAASHNHAQHATHAHINLIGWVTFAIYGLYYDRFKEAARGLLAKIHFWGSQVGFITTIIGIWLIYSGKPEADPIAAVGSMILAASTVVFVVIVFRQRAS